jgi:hypothetical protein
MQRAKSMATVSEEVAASCHYALPRGGKSLEGYSVRLAEIVAATYGNIRAGARVISNDGKVIVAQGVCHDLETNTAVTIEVRRKITDKHGKTYTEDMQIVTGNAACAIAFRNAVFKAIPSALVNDVAEEAKRVARGSVETLPERRKKAVEYLHQLGVKDEQICSVLAIKRVEDIDLDHLQTLRGIVTRIKDGESTVKEIFDPQPETVTLEELKALYEEKLLLVSEADKKNYDRIIEKKEEKSYKKAYETLKSLK